MSKLGVEKWIEAHRIQDGKAIISLVLRRKHVLDNDFDILEWTGDAYELRQELNLYIAKLEGKHNADTDHS